MWINDITSSGSVSLGKDWEDFPNVRLTFRKLSKDFVSVKA